MRADHQIHMQTAGHPLRANAPPPFYLARLVLMRSRLPETILARIRLHDRICEDRRTDPAMAAAIMRLRLRALVLDALRPELRALHDAHGDNAGLFRSSAGGISSQPDSSTGAEAARGD